MVVFPTETVYGVGADARDEAAVERVFELKGRPSNRAVTVHLAPGWPLTDWAAEVPPAADVLGRAFWPGPLSVVLPARSDVPRSVRGGGDTVGLRVPDHPVALAMLSDFGAGIVGSSANRHGYPAAATLEAARSAVPGADVYLDGGPCRLGVGSTVVELRDDEVVVHRVGAVPVADVEGALGRGVGRGMEAQ